MSCDLSKYIGKQVNKQAVKDLDTAGSIAVDASEFFSERAGCVLA